MSDRAITTSALDEHWLRRTLELAERGRPGARPNPVVGAVIASGDQLLAEGWHARRGDLHAERAALATWGDDRLPDDATMYVSLEPCSHHGRQPPCTDAIIGAGIRRVVICGADSNRETAGIGPRKLSDAGIEVAWAAAEIAAAAFRQNAGFHSLHRRGRPYVTAKWAMTRNGRFTTGDRQRRWITSEPAREHVHHLRAASGAILVGVGTVLADDPLLTVRGPAADGMLTPPTRVVVDRTLRMPVDGRLATTSGAAPLLVATTPAASPRRRSALEAAGAEVWVGPSGDELLPMLLDELGRRMVCDLLVEAGPTLLSSLDRQGLIDRLACFVAPFDAPDDEPGLEAGHPIRQHFHAPDLVTMIGPDPYAEVELGLRQDWAAER